MSDEFFINDGYTRTAEIPAEPGIHPALSITYRPGLLEQRFMFQRAASQEPAEQAKVAAGIVARHVTDWSARSGDSKAPIKPDTIRRMHPALLSKILDYVLGYAGSAEEEADVKN